jgi:sec-independent protein translocase protein TatA
MSIGVWQVVIILVIVLIIFGAGKLPHVMGDVAKGIKNFKKGMAEDESDSTKNIKKSETAEAPAAAKSESAEGGNKKT